MYNQPNQLTVLRGGVSVARGPSVVEEMDEFVEVISCSPGLPLSC